MDSFLSCKALALFLQVLDGSLLRLEHVQQTNWWTYSCYNWICELPQTKQLAISTPSIQAIHPASWIRTSKARRKWAPVCYLECPFLLLKMIDAQVSEAKEQLSDYDSRADGLWSVYIKEVESYDRALMEAWKGDLDSITIFMHSTPSSASCSTFLIGVCHPS